MFKVKDAKKKDPMLAVNGSSIRSPLPNKKQRVELAPTRPERAIFIGDDSSSEDDSLVFHGQYLIRVAWLRVEVGRKYF